MSSKVAATLAVARAGAVAVFLSPQSNVDEIGGIVQDVRLDGICCSLSLNGLVPDTLGAAAPKQLLFDHSDPVVFYSAADGSMQDERDALLGINAATVRFSLGTTGASKGIVNSHETLLERAKVHYQSPPLAKDDAVLWVQPLGRLPGPLAYLFRGAKLVIGDAFDSASLGELVRRERITHLYTAPMFFRAALNDDFAASSLDRVRYFLSGGTALGKETAEAFATKFGREIVEHYGLVETGTVFMNKSGDPKKRGSIGQLVRAEARLVSDNGEEVPGEGDGELRVRCAGMFDAYYRPWRLAGEFLADGWYNTGDVARRDADGYYWIVGRTKEMINVAGIKVFPQGIEAVLASHPAVEEAMVYGAADRRFGEVPKAKVKLKLGECAAPREMLAYVNDRLPVIKSLRGVEFVQAIPKTQTGKIKRLG